MKCISYKPLSMSVANTSTLIAPAVLGEVAALAVWTLGQTVAVGDQRRHGDNGYVCIAKTTGVCATAPTVTDGDDTSDGAVTWRFIRPRINQRILTNDSDSVMYLNFGSAAVANKGIRLNANGGTFNSAEDFEYCPQDAVYGIAAAAGGKNICIWES